MATAPVRRNTGKVSVIPKKPVQAVVGMTFEEITQRFLRSRKNGTGGARLQATERTIQEYEYDLNRFFGWLKTRCHVGRYEDVTRDHINAYVDQVQNSDLAKSSKNHVWRSLRVFFRWVERDPECRFMNLVPHTDTLPTITANDQRVYIPTQAEVRDFLESFDTNTFDGIRDYAATAFLLDTGARIGELCNVTPEDFKWDVGLVLLDGKTGKRQVPFSVDKLGAVMRRYQVRRDQRVVPESEGEAYFFITRFSGKTNPILWDKVFARHRASTKIGISDEGNLSPHACRHFYCTQYLVNGGTLHALQRITGHTSIKTLEKYLHMANQMGYVAEEHSRVSPFANLKGGALGKKTRKVR